MTITNELINYILISGAVLLLLCFIIQLYYHFYYYNRLIRMENSDKTFTEEQPPLSIILCVEDQVDELRKNLPHLLDQEYPKFEIIVIDMASQDETREYLEYMEKEHDNLYYSFTPESARFISRRKLAQTIGVKASKYDWLVFTEANCQPNSKFWLEALARNMTEKTEIILGYSGYEYEKSGLNRFITYDNLLTAMRYLGLALAKKPYMGQGRNMAYRKRLFLEGKVFSNQLNLKRGEDDLFINNNATATNTRVELSPNSQVTISPLKKFKYWRDHKLSHLTSAQRYEGKKHYVVGFETTTRFLIYLTAIPVITGAILCKYWIILGIAVGLLILRWITQAYTLNKSAKKFKVKHRYYLSLFYYNIRLPWEVFLLKFRLPKRRKGNIVKL